MNNQDKNTYYSYKRPEMLGFIPQGAKKVLDIGCGEGSFATSIKKKFNSEVWGVEMNPLAAEIAKKNIDRILVGDVLKIMDEIPNSYFDCIIFNDVLEHMVDPYTVLEKIKTKLNNNGVIVCSIPNIRHISALKKLLINGVWRYEDAGLFDKTHLRFFTKKSIVEMFENLDYNIIKIVGINPTKWWKFYPITLGLMPDTRFIQFAVVAKIK